MAGVTGFDAAWSRSMGKALLRLINDVRFWRRRIPGEGCRCFSCELLYSGYMTNGTGSFLRPLVVSSQPMDVICQGFPLHKP
jgi:hypothetical protein